MQVVPAATWLGAQPGMTLVVNPHTRLIRIQIGRLFSLNSTAATEGTMFSASHDLARHHLAHHQDKHHQSAQVHLADSGNHVTVSHP